jgi:anti-repressor protein
MEELVFKSEKGTPVTSSLLVAQKFGKSHKDVLRAIDNVIAQTPENQSKRNFALSEYIDASGKSNRMYIMTKDGFSAVVLGFTGEQAIKFRWEYIEAFNKMEEAIKSGNFKIPQTYSEALMIAAKQAEQIEVQQKQLAFQAPKVALMEKILDTDQKIDIGQASKILGLSFGRNTLFVKLREKGVFFKNRNEPKQEYIERGYFELK